MPFAAEPETYKVKSARERRQKFGSSSKIVQSNIGGISIPTKQHPEFGLALRHKVLPSSATEHAPACSGFGKPIAPKEEQYSLKWHHQTWWSSSTRLPIGILKSMTGSEVSVEVSADDVQWTFFRTAKPAPTIRTEAFLALHFHSVQDQLVSFFINLLDTHRICLKHWLRQYLFFLTAEPLFAFANVVRRCSLFCCPVVIVFINFAVTRETWTVQPSLVVLPKTHSLHHVQTPNMLQRSCAQRSVIPNRQPQMKDGPHRR